MGDNIKTAFDVVTKLVVTGIVKEMIEDVFKVDYDEQKKGIRAPIRNAMEGALLP